MLQSWRAREREGKDGRRWERWKEPGGSREKEGEEEEAEVGEMGERQRETEGDRAIILTNSLRALLKGG